MDELINELLNPSPQAVWSICPFCKARVKTKNLHEHLRTVHPKTIDKSKGAP